MHAGTPDDGFDVSVTYPAETLTLPQLLGPTLVVSGSRVSVAGFTGTDFFGNQITLQNHPIGVPFSALLGKVGYFSLPTYVGGSHFTGGLPISDQADASYSSFLVRAVPEPSTSILLLGGLVVLLGSRLRRSQHTPHRLTHPSSGPTNSYAVCSPLMSTHRFNQAPLP